MVVQKSGTDLLEYINVMLTLGIELYNIIGINVGDASKNCFLARLFAYTLSLIVYIIIIISVGFHKGRTNRNVTAKFMV